jgi:hypothetical protein
MPWKCFMLAAPPRLGEWHDTDSGGRTLPMFYPLPDGREVEFQDLPVGAMWTEPAERTARGIDSLAVLLPGRVIWRMDDSGTNGFLWTRSGNPPEVTMFPSINFVGIYHGWLRNGILSDDVDRRLFNHHGIRIAGK